MPLSLNGKATALPSPPTLEALLRAIALQRPFAVAHNEEFVSSADFGHCELQDGDRIDIVHPSAGG